MLLITYGTRPEWIKIKPLIEYLKNEGVKYRVLFTGQHDNFFNSECNYSLMIPERKIDRLNNIFTSISSSIALEELNPDWVLVQGDTASVFAIALKYYNLGKKIIHLEAGLRTYDLNNPCPEEAYRQMVSRITSLHLCPTMQNVEYLKQEKCSGRMDWVGNTVLDNIVNTPTSYQNKILCTLHRRENLPIIGEWFTAINNLAIAYPNYEFLLPMHPNPVIQQQKKLLPNVKVVNSLQHDELIDYMKDVKAVITDSGGIQEEATFLQKKIIVCRKESERDLTTNHIHMCHSPEDIEVLFKTIIESPEISEKCPYGDGNTSEKIFKIFKELSIV